MNEDNTKQTISVDEYQRRAMAKEADQLTLYDRKVEQGVKAVRLENACRGLADDCGELNGAVKKWLEYQQPLDEVNVLEEIGDCLWRLAQACKAINKNLSDAMEANLRKLEQVRYKGTKCNPKDALEDNRDRDEERRAIAEDDGVLYSEEVNENKEENNITTECPKCGSNNPKLHPAMQFEGEVQICNHPFHGEIEFIPKTLIKELKCGESTLSKSEICNFEVDPGEEDGEWAEGHEKRFGESIQLECSFDSKFNEKEMKKEILQGLKKKCDEELELYEEKQEDSMIGQYEPDSFEFTYREPDWESVGDQIDKLLKDINNSASIDQANQLIPKIRERAVALNLLVEEGINKPIYGWRIVGKQIKDATQRLRISGMKPILEKSIILEKFKKEVSRSRVLEIEVTHFEREKALNTLLERVLRDAEK